MNGIISVIELKKGT